MDWKHLLKDITFAENGPIEVSQLNSLYRMIGWDKERRRSDTETTEMLGVSHYYIAAHTVQGQLVGFARVCGDPYIVQVLDVITHPDYRRRGIATRCMEGIVAHLQRSHYVSITLTDGSGIEGFYQRFGFRLLDTSASALVWKPLDLLQIYGTVTPRNRPEDFQQIREEIEREIAEEVLSEDKGVN
jgi:GNAT superfamily N-acetyltransferase